VAVPVSRQEYGIATRDLPEQQRGRWVAIRGSHHLPMGHRQRRQPGKAATADDCEHETCLISFGFSVGNCPRLPADSGGGRNRAAAHRRAEWKAPGIHDIIMETADIPLI
jgi:hypothetical protein